MIFYELIDADRGARGTGPPVPDPEASPKSKQRPPLKRASVLSVGLVLGILIVASMGSHMIEFPAGANTFRELAVVWLSGAAGLFFGENSGFAAR